MAGVITDATERKYREEKLHTVTDQLAAANQELSQANGHLLRVNEDLDNFVYTASHDLRSPINAMEGLIIALGRRMKGRLEPTDEVLLSHLSGSMQKLNRTINELSEIVKAGKDTSQPAEPIDLPELLAEMKEGLSALPETAPAILVTDWQVEQVQYPRKVLRSVLYNLLSNAAKYRHGSRPVRITIRTELAGKGVRLSVQDNGLGLSPEQAGKLFKMFGRLHPHIEGTGIGLYTIKRMVENYGGSISVESVPGAGTTFFVGFPLA